MQSRARFASWPDAVLAGSLASLALLAWWSLWLWRHSPEGHWLMHGSSPPPMAMAHPLRFMAIFTTGWTLMTIAMMLPTSIPLLVLFHRMIRGKCGAWRLLALVIAGYLAIWASIGAVLQATIWMLYAGVGRVLLPGAARWFASAALLAVAGLFQFSKLKYACLDKCRSPMSFLVSHWRGGSEPTQALRLGAVHGLFCVGCCWSLMALMFVVGAGSLTGMLALGVVMALEKNFAWGRRLGAPLGWLLLAGAAAAATVGFRA